MDFLSPGRHLPLGLDLAVGSEQQRLPVTKSSAGSSGPRALKADSKQRGQPLSSDDLFFKPARPEASLATLPHTGTIMAPDHPTPALGRRPPFLTTCSVSHDLCGPGPVTSRQPAPSLRSSRPMTGKSTGCEDVLVCGTGARDHWARGWEGGEVLPESGPERWQG